MEDVGMVLDGEFYGTTEAPIEIIDEMLAKPEAFKITMNEDGGNQTHKATMCETEFGFTLMMERIH